MSTDNTITEADDDELIPVETKPEDAETEAQDDKSGDDEDDDHEDDERLAQSEEDSDEDITSGTSNRDRRRKRREIQKKARDAAQRELEFLRKTVAELSQRVAQNETHTARTTAQTIGQNIEQQLARAVAEVQQAEAIIAAATEAGNGQDAVAALRIRDQAREEMNRLQNAKQQLETQQQEAMQPRIDPAVVNYAKEWMEANPWYNPAATDTDSAVTKAIDSQLAREGYDPRSRLYWEELTNRVAGALGDGDGAQQPTTPRRKAPPTGNTREHAPVSTKREVYVTPERKAAMIEAGVWDDPVLRQRYLKAYKAYDNGSAR